MIKKYTLQKYGTTEFCMPVEQFLAVQMQNDQLVMWIDDSTPLTRDWTIYSLYTGDAAPKNADYLGTVQDRSLVYHVYAS